MSSSKIINSLVRAGVSLIPVHEESKNPLVKEWKGHPPLDTLALWDLMDRFNTRAVAAVLGTASGRLCCIDIDTKYKAGFDAIIFADIKSFYPHLWDKVRVERTPSGGYHILYRIGESEEPLPNCPKICNRAATDAELLANPKEKTKCFVEIKCEGGLTQMYPSPNYEVVQDKPLNVLTFDEHSSLINLVASYNEVVKEVKVKVDRLDKEADEYYSENPFVDFNNSARGATILEDNGWTVYGQNGKYIYYSKPNKKEKGVSAGFNREKRLYTIWTASTELDPKSYSPSNLLCDIKFGGNKKELYAWLINEGFGKLKEAVEKRIVKKAAKFGHPLQGNISEDGKKVYEEEKEKLSGAYPYGIFWDEAPDGGYMISRENLYHVSGMLGFRIWNEEICYVTGYIVEKIDERKYFDIVKEYIKKDLEDDYESICNTYEAFLQKSGKFTTTRLPILEHDKIIKSTKHVSYKCYKNCFVYVDKDTIEPREYTTLEKGVLVWKHQIQNRNFVKGSHLGLYHDYLDKACGITEHLFKCIGYYAHEYKSAITPYIVVCCEMVEDSKNGGGTGKNIFANMFNFITSFINKAAKNLKVDDTMLRTWKGEKVMSINEAEKNFPYIDLREFVSGQWEVGKKFKQEYTISNSELPKIMVNTNFSFDSSLPGLKRRVIPLEFTDFFTKIGGVDVWCKKYFPMDDDLGDWEEQDWIGFDNFMMISIQTFIQGGCKLYPPELSDGGWTKQFEQKYGKVIHEFIKLNIDDWCRLGSVKVKDFSESWNLYCIENNVGKNFVLSSIKQNEALTDYCSKFGIEFQKLVNTRENNIYVSVKTFKKIGIEEQIEESGFNLDEDPF